MPLSPPSSVSLFATDGFVDDSSAVWTRTANTTFTVVGDRTAVFQKGTRLRVTDSTVKYFVVVGSSFAVATTTVTITGGTDYVLAADPTARAYSYAESPSGYPTSFTYVPTWTGGSPTIGNGTLTGKFQVVGGRCFVDWILLAGNTTTFGAGTYSWALPVTATFNSEPMGIAYCLDSSAGAYFIALPLLATATTLQLLGGSTAATAATFIASNSPMVWANADQIQSSFSYLI